MSGLTIAPNFNRIDRAVAFPAKKLNYLLEEKVVDRFEYYQRRFGVYHFMQLTSNLKHKIYFPRTSPFMWQPFDSCAWTPGGNISIGENEINPCKSKLNEEHCYDSMFDSCFEHFLNYNGKGPVMLNAEGNRMMNVMLRSLLNGMVLGAKLILTAGKLYDYSKVKQYFKQEATAKTRKMIERNIGTCKGWVELAKEMGASSYAWMNASELLVAEQFEGKKFTGDILTVVDGIYDKRTPEMDDMVDSGGFEDFSTGETVSPIWLFSQSMVKNIADRHRKECNDPLCKNPRITSEMDGTRKVYFIDGIPVIPVNDLNAYDMYLNGATHLAVLTVTGNIQMGVSADNLPSLANSNPGMGMRIQQSTDNENYGKYTFLSHALFSTAIANPQLFIGAQKFLTYEV